MNPFAGSRPVRRNLAALGNFQKMNSKPPIELEEGWAAMEQGFTKLTIIMEGKETSQFDSTEYITLYTTIYDMCTQKPPADHSRNLYERYKKRIDGYLVSTVLDALEGKHDEFLLRELHHRWGNHKVMVRWMSRFFNYLDRYYIPRRNLDSLNRVGMICFRDMVYQQMKAKFRRAVARLIEREREGEQIDRASLNSAVNMFVEIGLDEMGLYQEDFEKYILQDTSSYYSRKASIWIVEATCPDYMAKTEDCLGREKDRVSHYLHSSTETKLVERVQHELLVVYTNQLMEKENSGCRALLRDDKVDDLARMYRLFHRIPNGLEPVSAVFKQHVTNEGMVVVQKAEEAARNKAESAGGSEGHVFVREVIDLHDKYMKYVNYCFAGSSTFHKALKEAFEVFCNKMIAGNSSAELLATYCDHVLKKGGDSKTSSDKVIEETIDKVVSLLVYIGDKDLFAEFHKKKLARRLLFDKSANDDHEKLILTKLKQQCGAQFTSKMEGMVNDFLVAKDFQGKFQNYLDIYPTATRGVYFSVTVLTTGFWPTYKTSDLRLPAEMVRCVEIFKKFYSDTTTKRKLAWIFSFGSCNITVKCDSRTFELVVATYQAAALLLFNDAERLSYAEIKEQLNLGDEDVTRVLHSLSCAKYKILKKEPSTKLVSRNDVFEFNYKFTDKMRRIRIPLPQVDEKKKILEDVDKDRKYTIDASLVRIMKSRKVLNHQQLVQECVEQLSRIFKPDIKAIKKRIEDLITRDYLERDKDQPNLYKYLA